MLDQHAPELTTADVFLDAVPDYIEAHREAHARWLESRPSSGGGLEFVTADLERWAPGQVLRVAFLGGSYELHQKIEGVVEEISAACNLRFDFGHDPENRRYRSWSQDDRELAAEIRVSFDRAGYFSLVGTESAAPIGARHDDVGGYPWQRSLNLGGFDRALPPQWRGTVLHEFLHAIAFHHEHQNLKGPCQAEFRWEDDPGYALSRDARGGFMSDYQGRRPGIYTYLSGYPNFWSRAKVDLNLRPANQQNIAFGEFDRASVMLYRFPPLFYRTQPSPCAPDGDGQSLSAGDKRGLLHLYPHAREELQELGARQQALLGALRPGGTEEGADGGFSYERRAAGILRRNAAALRGSAGGSSTA
ncbi:hypothetical protein [Sorangium sp. So ce385]|uniref:hypothetical protein n=1 Tax=Sorangium sp. So ce385 TaxID=3133308 RepID=UPI003F5BFE7F